MSSSSQSGKSRIVDDGQRGRSEADEQAASEERIGFSAKRRVGEERRRRREAREGRVEHSESVEANRDIPGRDSVGSGSGSFQVSRTAGRAGVLY